MFKKLVTSRFGRLALAGAATLALSAPAVAGHFDFSSFTAGEPLAEVPAVTAEDVHVECPEAAEDQTEEETTAACDAVVASVVGELMSSEHPENHGKYVSFVANCLEGSRGKGEAMRTIARVKGEGRTEMAVRLCAEGQLEQATAPSSDGDAEVEADDDSEEPEPAEAESALEDGPGRGKGSRAAGGEDRQGGNPDDTPSGKAGGRSHGGR